MKAGSPIYFLPILLATFCGLAGAQVGPYTLTITADHGSVQVNPDKELYDEGEVVELIPQPDTGYCFTDWSGDVYSKRLVLYLIMDSDKTITANFGTWEPPIGIPRPEFGIEETYRMYDDPANRNPALTYTQNAEGGYYTHYVDNTHPEATDTGNPYGMVDKPRMTMPTLYSSDSVPEGSVVEVHGGPYNYGIHSGGYYWSWFSGAGTKARPVFIRGNSETDKPVFTLMTIRVGGSYVIIENFDLNDSRIGEHSERPGTHHVSYRNLEIHGGPIGFYNLIYVRDGSHIVVYNNHVHDNGDPNYPEENDVVGFFAPALRARYIWIVDNHMHGNGGDSVLLGNSGVAPLEDVPHYVYIGRNLMHDERENAVDLKGCSNVIVSENTAYGFEPCSSSDGTPIIVNDDPPHENIWFIYNTVYNSKGGMRFQDSCNIIGNVVYDSPLGIGGYGYTTITAAMISNTIYNGYIWFGSGWEATVDIVDNIIVDYNGSSDNLVFVRTSEVAQRSTMHHNLLFQPTGSARISWGLGSESLFESLTEFQQRTGKGEGCVEADPLFIDAEDNNFRLQSASPVIDSGTASDIYQTFFDLYGIDIRKDIEGRARPQGSGWDIGAYEYILIGIVDLEVSGTSQNSVTVVWTMPGEEGVADRPWQFDIRYSTSTITGASWDVATQVQGEPAPKNFGQQQSFTITGLNPNTTYYVAMKTSNNTGSTTSPLSNVVSGTTTASGNHAPVLELIGDKSIEENQTLTFVVNATDADPGDTLIYSAADIPTGADFNPATRTFVWTPSSSQSGIYRVTFQVSDGQVTVSETIMITVIGVQSSLTISSTSGGSVTDPGEGIFSYNEGSFVSIQATPAANYHFVNWTGTAVEAGKVTNPNAAITTVKMDTDYTVQANFAIDQRTLTFSSTIGGAVTVPGEGDFQYNHGTFVAIRATAESNYHFVNWTGTAVNAGKVVNPNAAQTTVTADADYTVIANFGEHDGVPPTVTNLSPTADDIQVPLNSLIILHVTDAGIGVNASSVTITLDGDTIYTGDVINYNSASGHCYRVGTTADYTYVYQSDENFGFDQTLTVTVNAADLGGTTMDERSYSFTTEMRLFGQNKQVDPTVEGLDKAGPSTARDSSGNIWAVWHAGPVGSRDIYIAKLAAGSETFDGSIPLISNVADQSNPAIAVGADDRLYVIWQDNRQADDNKPGEWDVYISTSVDGVTWSVETRVNDPNDGNQTNPAIVVDGRSPNYAHVVWQDDRAGHQDICIASSNDGFVTKTVTQITNDPSDQTGPVVAVDSSNVVYVLWTDARNPANGYDIYGAASNVGPWTNVPVVAKEAAQSDPVIAAESTESILHILWVDQTSGANGIYYASSNGLPSSALAGDNLVDSYAVGKGQFSPTVAVTGSAGNGLGVFACWHDERDVSGGLGDSDIWFVQANTGSGTNVFVGDGGTNSNQTEPAIGVDQYGQPYILWTDDRNANSEIYFAASTYMKPTALATARVTPTSLDMIVGTDPQNITDVDDFSVELLAGTCPYDVNITLTEIANPPEEVLQYFLNGCDFGPSGITFTIPVTITIPYAVIGATGTPTAYWYNSRTGALSQEGITNIETIELTSSLHALQFKTTHLTSFFAVRNLPVSGGGGGGGCALSRSQEGSIVEYFFPYVILAFVLIVLKWRDRKFRTHFEKTTSS